MTMRWMAMLTAVSLWALPASAQDYPQRQIRVLEPLAASSAVDVVTRIVADRMGRILGQTLFVDNQPGAAGLLGMRAGLRAVPDGYTILAVNDSVLSVLPNMRKDAGYDPRRDFVPIVELVKLHWALVSNPGFAPKTVPELIAAAKAKPGEINYASGGDGSPQHIAMELFMRATGIKLTHVPYRGVTPALTDVVSGHVPMMFVAFPSPLPFRASHQLDIIGTGDLTRLAATPDVPSIAEQNLPGFEFLAWGALLAPAGTPPAIVAKLNKAAIEAMADPAIHKQLTDLGYEVVGGTPDALGKLIAADFVSKGELLRAANIHSD